MARRKRPSELHAQLARRLATMDPFKRNVMVRNLVEDALVLRFFEGDSIEEVSVFSGHWWPRERQSVETAVRRHIYRRDRREGK